MRNSLRSRLENESLIIKVKLFCSTIKFTKLLTKIMKLLDLKACNFIKKKLQHSCFYCESCKKVLKSGLLGNCISHPLTEVEIEY